MTCAAGSVHNPPPGGFHFARLAAGLARIRRAVHEGFCDGQHLVRLGAVDRARAGCRFAAGLGRSFGSLLEIIIGAIAGNLVDMPLTPWVNYLAGFGAILLTFLAGAEIDAKVIRRHFGSTMAIGAVGFFAPYLGVLAWAHFISGWPWPQAQIAGIALSTTSVAVVYAVMVETGFNDTEIGKIILAACFINDIGT